LNTTLQEKDTLTTGTNMNYKKTILITLLTLLVSGVIFLNLGLLNKSDIKTENQPKSFVYPNGKKLGEKISKLSNLLNSVNEINSLNAIENLNETNVPIYTKKVDNQNNFEMTFDSSFFYKNETFDREFFKKVFSHEYAHVLSLQNKQIETFSTLDKSNVEKNLFDLEDVKCRPNYYNLEGCFKSESYISTFYKKFWIGELKSNFDNIQKIGDKNVFQDEMLKWSVKYKENFVSNNAFLSPEEDMAESFSLWVNNTDATKLNTVQKEKILFFNEFPELLRVKTIINNELK
jgi:hypothetical protein